MIRHIRDIAARRRGDQLEYESGFTLIELLIVIVVLGILAATVVFALSGVTNQSASAACSSDAKSYEVATAAFQNSPQNASNTAAAATNDLTGTASGGPFLHAAANNTAYAIAITGDTGLSTGVKNWSGTPALPAGAAPNTVYVLDRNDATPGWVNFDNQTATDGCNSTNL